jgi:hypothetical protein
MLTAAGSADASVVMRADLLPAAGASADAPADVAISSCYKAEDADVVLKQLSLHCSWLITAWHQPAGTKQCRKV